MAGNHVSGRHCKYPHHTCTNPSNPDPRSAHVRDSWHFRSSANTPNSPGIVCLHCCSRNYHCLFYFITFCFVLWVWSNFAAWFLAYLVYPPSSFSEKKVKFSKSEKRKTFNQISTDMSRLHRSRKLFFPIHQCTQMTTSLVSFTPPPSLHFPSLPFPPLPFPSVHFKVSKTPRKIYCATVCLKCSIGTQHRSRETFSVRVFTPC